MSGLCPPLSQLAVSFTNYMRHMDILQEKIFKQSGMINTVLMLSMKYFHSLTQNVHVQMHAHAKRFAP